MKQINTLTIFMGVSLLASCTNQISFDPTTSPPADSQDQSSHELPSGHDSSGNTPDEEDDAYVPIVGNEDFPSEDDNSSDGGPGDEPSDDDNSGGSNGDTDNEPPSPAPIFKTETFFQSDVPKVDILFIDDNSRSMKKEQEKMGSRFSNFMKDLNDVDWHIGITTTDVSNGPYSRKGKLLDVDHNGNRFITTQSPDPETLFLNTIVRPEVSCPNNICPSGDERPLEASILAMQRHERYNQGFFRDGVDLAIVILTDEDEGSTGSGATGNDVLEKFKEIWGDTKTVRGYGIITQPKDVDCLNNQGTYYAYFVNAFVLLTGGVTGSICDADYSQSLENISEDVKNFILTFELSEQPIADTVQVEMEPDQTILWSLKGKEVIFESAPLPNTQINVSYQGAIRSFAKKN